MKLLNKLATAFRGGTRETLEWVVDANGLRIFEQEIQDCENEIMQAKQELSHVIAEKIRIERESKNLQQTLDEKETQATTLLRQEQTEAAKEVAQWIADFEPVLGDQRERLMVLRAHESRLITGLHKAIRQVEEFRRELRMTQATNSAHKATRRVSGRVNSIGDHLVDAKESLERIKQRQQSFTDSVEATGEVESSLSTYGHPGGFSERKTSVESVLGRLQRGLQEASGE